MWFFYNVNNKNYLMSSSYDDKSFSVYCSDLVHIWLEIITLEEFDNRFKNLNGIEMPMDKLKAKIHSMLYDNRSNTKFDLTPKEDNLEMRLESKSKDLSISLQFNLQKGSPELFFEKITLPTLNLLLKKQTREVQLIDIIKTKDIELNEHKLSGHFIENKKLCTGEFSAENFNAITKFEPVFDPETETEFKVWITKEKIPTDHPEDSNGEPSNGIDEENILGNSSLLNSKVKRSKYRQQLSKRGRR